MSLPEKHPPPIEIPEKGEFELPNGCTLYWQTNEVGGRTYTSDEVGGGCFVWDTAIVDQGTLLAALYCEQSLVRMEVENKREKAMQELANQAQKLGMGY